MNDHHAMREMKPLGTLRARRNCEVRQWGAVKYWRQEVVATVPDPHPRMAAKGYRHITARFYLHLN